MKYIFGIILLIIVVSVALATRDVDNDKITICHKGQTISIDQHALEAHEKHGDYEGSCTDENNDNNFCKDSEITYQTQKGIDGCSTIREEDVYGRGLCFYEVATFHDVSTICEQGFKHDDCYSDVAVGTKNICVCSLIENNMQKDYCYRQIAIDLIQPDVCEEISSQVTKDNCYIHVGKAKKDLSVCDRIPIYSDRDSCYVGVAIATDNIEICKQVITYEFKDACYAIKNI